MAVAFVVMEDPAEAGLFLAIELDFEPSFCRVLKKLADEHGGVIGKDTSMMWASQLVTKRLEGK